MRATHDTSITHALDACLVKAHLGVRPAQPGELKMTYVVMGVTGRTGKVVAETLLAARQPVRVVVRKPEQGAEWKARGAEVAIGAYEDQASLQKAFTGAKGVYAMHPPDMAAKNFIAESAVRSKTLTAALVAAQVPHVVLLSSFGAQLPDGTGPIRTVHAIEKDLDAAGLPRTFLRPTYFLENFGAVLPAVKGDGVLPSFFPAGFQLEAVTTTDIGRTAAQLLLDGPRGRRVVELDGIAPTTPAEIAEVLGKLLGKKVTVAEAPLAAVVPAFTSMGISADVAGLYHEMIGGLISGHVRGEGPAKVEHLRGKVTLEEGLKALLG
jgi:uncharacterized protein YbjT (DUF2867 family)